MTALQIASVVFICTFGGAMVGMYGRKKLPNRYFGSEERESIKLSVGVIATMTALVLGLVTASAKSSFDADGNLIKQAAVQVLTLDRLLSRYGPETDSIRADLKRLVASRTNVDTWAQIARTKPDAGMSKTELLTEEIRSLSAKNERQTALKTQAISVAESLAQIRWAVLKEEGHSIPTLFIVLLVCWLTFTFTSFGLMSPGNRLLATISGVCALSVSSAVFLLLEMDSAFSGWLTVSLEPLKIALQHLK